MKKNNNWFEFAKDDLTAARACLEKGVYNLACFHAQQGAEKTLKGYLAAKGKDIPKVHSIGALLKLCSDINKEFKKLEDKSITLDDYYIPTRHPDALPGAHKDGLPNENDAKEAIAVLEVVMEFVKKAISF